MRYFFITYTCWNTSSNCQSIGELTAYTETFPGKQWIKDQVRMENRDRGVYVDRITITGLFEFSNKEDFNSFRNG